ncbi:MAG: MFS transporter [Candidatus Heimdallarchaeota archaeon]
MTKINISSRTSKNGDHSGILRSIIIVNFFFRIFSEGFRTLLVPFSVDVLKLDIIKYGLIQSIGGYAAMGAVFLLGMLVDIQFKKVTMIIGIVSAFLAALLFPRIQTYGFSIFFYCLFTIGVLMMMISTNTFIANETQKGEQRTKGFSWNMVSRGVASAIAPISFTVLLQIANMDYEWVYLILGGFGLIAGVLVFVLRLKAEDTPTDEIDYAKNLSEKSGDDYASFESADEKKSIRLVQLSFGLGRMLMGFASGIAIPFIGIYMYDQFSLSELQWGLLNSILWIVITFGYLFMNFIAERVGKAVIVVIYWTLVIPAAVGIMLAGTAGKFYLTSFFFILRFIFAMTPSAAWNSFLFEWIPPKNRGKIMGLLQTGQRGLRATGTLIGGLIFDDVGATIFPIAMIAYPIAGLLPLIISNRVKKKTKALDDNAEASDKVEEIIDDDITFDDTNFPVK